ncbi:hypothetical protein WH279_13800 [Erwinia sp. MYb375]|uniref:hypothetical protein n=1 Tax=unclassified Erwinia TaxID=2622719 RepID=UPI0030A7D24D
MSERCFFEFAGEKFAVYAGTGVNLKAVMVFLTPSFKMIDTLSDVTCTLTLNINKFATSWVDDEKPWRMPPVLNVDLDDNGGGLRIINYSAEEKTIYREPEKDSAGVLIEINDDNRKWNVTISQEGELNNKTFARTIKQLVGYCANKKNAQVIHASCAVIDDTSYVFFGPRGSGKSSFLFRCCTDLKADFKSDDLLVSWIEGENINLSGWPRRMGITLSAFDDRIATGLKIDTLRRKQHLVDNWVNNIGQHCPPESRKRILFDVDEFMHFFNVNYRESTGKLVFIMLNYLDKKDALDIYPLNSIHDRLLFTNPNQERHFTDYLNMSPSPLVPGRKHSFEKLTSNNNLFSLQYGSDVFSDFYNSWQRIENEIKKYAPE